MPSEYCMDVWAMMPELVLAGLALALVSTSGFARVGVRNALGDLS